MKTNSRPLQVALLLVSIGFSACGRAERPEQESAAGVTAPAAASSAAAKAVVDAPSDVGARMVVSEATLSVRTARPEIEADALGRFANDVGGYVVSRDAQRSDDVVKSVETTLRVPAPKFEATLGELRRHGTVLRETVSGQDVTEDYLDTDAALKSKRRLEERLLHIVEGSTTVKDTLEVENELTRVRTEIERLEGHSKFLANRVAFATIHATFVSPDQPETIAAESVWSRYANAFREAGSVFTHVTAGMVVALGAFVPVAMPVFLGFLVVRRRRRLLTAKVAE